MFITNKAVCCVVIFVAVFTDTTFASNEASTVQPSLTPSDTSTGPSAWLSTANASSTATVTGSSITASGSTGHTSASTAAPPTSHVTNATASSPITSSVVTSATPVVTANISSSTAAGSTAPGNFSTTHSAPTTTPQPASCPSFHAGSFFGGIVLGAGLVVIGYVVYRWYRSRNGVPYQHF